jgi:hypothetical protein
MDTDRINQLRDDIAHFARTPQKARELVLVLADTNWEALIHGLDIPHLECLICKQSYQSGKYDILSCHFDMCQICREKHGWNNRKTLNKENRKFHFNLQRARDKGLPATLTFPEWIMTLEYFQWKCSICQLNPYQIEDHFIPIVCGGGTTKGNIVPLCKACDKHKRWTHPSEITDLPQEALRRVAAYLQQFS